MMLMALALLSANLIPEGFDAVKCFAKEQGVYNETADLFGYINRFWINFGPEGFSEHDRAHRTNNAIEGFHSALIRYIKTAHIYGFLCICTYILLKSIFDLILHYIYYREIENNLLQFRNRLADA
jgi:hypothetical protein